MSASVDVLAMLDNDTGGATGSDLMLLAQEMAVTKAMGALLYHSGKASHADADSEYQAAVRSFAAALHKVRAAVAELIEQRIESIGHVDMCAAGHAGGAADRNRSEGEDAVAPHHDSAPSRAHGGTADGVSVQPPLFPSAALARVKGGAA